MVHASRCQRVRRVSGGVLTAALLAACGGGEILAVLQIVTPLAGSWDDSAFQERINFLTPTPDEQVFQNRVNVTAEVRSAIGVCGAPVNDVANVEGTLDNGQLTLRRTGTTTPCLEGRFVDLRRFDAVANGALPARSYFNSRVDVRLQTGLWASESGQLKLKFETPSTVDNNSNDVDNVSGCDVTNTAAKVRFKGTLTGFNTTTLARPSAVELRAATGNALLFSAVEFVDGDTLTLRNAAGQALTLNRQPDPANTACPP